MRRNSRLRATPTRPRVASTPAPATPGTVSEPAIDFKGLLDALWKLPLLLEALDSSERERLTQNVKRLLSKVVTSLKDWSGAGDTALPGGIVEPLEQLVALNEKAQARIHGVELVSKLVREGIQEAIRTCDDKMAMGSTLEQTKNKLEALLNAERVQAKLIQESILEIEKDLTQLDGPLAPKRTGAAARSAEKPGKE